MIRKGEVREFAFFLSVAFASLGCARGPEGPQGLVGAERIYVFGQVTCRREAWVRVSFAPVIPWVTINRDTLAMGYYDPYAEDVYFYEDSVRVDFGDPSEGRLYQRCSNCLHLGARRFWDYLSGYVTNCLHSCG